MKEKNKRVRAKMVTVMLMVSLGMGYCSIWGNADIAKAASKKPKLNKTKIALTKGETFKLKLSNSKNVKWSSNKKSVATINKKGKVTAKKKGNAVISAKYLKKIYKCKVKVSDEIFTQTTEPTTEEIAPTVAPTKTLAPIVAPTKTPAPTVTPNTVTNATSTPKPIQLAECRVDCLSITNSLPKTFYYYLSSLIQPASSINLQSFECTTIRQLNGRFSISIKALATKTSDYKGSDSTTACYLAYKLYDKNHVVVDSGNMHNYNMKVGDTFYFEEIINNVPSGDYVLELSDRS